MPKAPVVSLDFADEIDEDEEGPMSTSFAATVQQVKDEIDDSIVYVESIDLANGSSTFDDSANAMDETDEYEEEIIQKWYMGWYEHIRGLFAVGRCDPSCGCTGYEKGAFSCAEDAARQDSIAELRRKCSVCGHQKRVHIPSYSKLDAALNSDAFREAVSAAAASSASKAKKEASIAKSEATIDVLKLANSLDSCTKSLLDKAKRLAQFAGKHKDDEDSYTTNEEYLKILADYFDLVRKISQTESELAKRHLLVRPVDDATRSQLIGRVITNYTAPMLSNTEMAATARKALKQFGFERFRPFQEQIITAALDGKDIFAIIPTGGGKSLCYQLPASLSKNGVTIVVSPLVALMEDQKNKLKQLGIRAEHVRAIDKKSDKQTNDTIARILAVTNKVQVVLCSPEKLATKSMRDLLTELHGSKRLERFVIDEAHCTTQWGRDWRKDFRRLGELRPRFPGVPITALTATAKDDLVIDVLGTLGMRNTLVFKMPVDRPNLFFSVLPRPPSAKVRKTTVQSASPAGNSAKLSLVDSINNWLINNMYRKESGIIYAMTKREAETIANGLKAKNFRAFVYHSGLGPVERSRVQDKWTRGEIDIMVATSAFGMGIDKSNVRFVVHTSLPESIEKYFQEVGRAGRDGELARCLLFYAQDDRRRCENLISMSQDSKESTRTRSEDEEDNGDDYNSDEDDSSANEELALSKLAPIWRQDRSFKLVQMLTFCENGTQCRRKMIVEYFNGAAEANNVVCDTMCDVCEAKKKWKEDKPFQVEAQVQDMCFHLLFLVAAAPNRLHSEIISLFKGNGKIEEKIQGCEKLPGFGYGKHAKEVAQVPATKCIGVDQLIRRCLHLMLHLQILEENIETRKISGSDKNSLSVRLRVGSKAPLLLEKDPEMLRKVVLYLPRLQPKDSTVEETNYNLDSVDSIIDFRFNPEDQDVAQYKVRWKSDLRSTWNEVVALREDLGRETLQELEEEYADSLEDKSKKEEFEQFLVLIQEDSSLLSQEADEDEEPEQPQEAPIAQASRSPVSPSILSQSLTKDREKGPVFSEGVGEGKDDFVIVSVRNERSTHTVFYRIKWKSSGTIEEFEVSELRQKYPKKLKEKEEIMKKRYSERKDEKGRDSYKLILKAMQQGNNVMQTRHTEQQQQLQTVQTVGRKRKRQEDDDDEQAEAAPASFGSSAAASSSSSKKPRTSGHRL